MLYRFAQTKLMATSIIHDRKESVAKATDKCWWLENISNDAFGSALAAAVFAGTVVSAGRLEMI